MPEVKSHIGSWCFKPELFEQNDERDKYTFNGILTCSEGDAASLEIVHTSDEFHHLLRNMMTIPTVWGQDSDGNCYTLFNVVFSQDTNTTKTTYRVNYVLIGEFVKDPKTPFTKRATIYYPYLRNWALCRRWDIEHLPNGDERFDVDFHNHDNIFSCELEDGLSINLYPLAHTHFDRFNAEIVADTTLNIVSEKDLELNRVLFIIAEFSQFLSVALFSRQRPNSITIKIDEGQPQYSFLFRVDKSKKPAIGALIKFDKLSERMPQIYRQWHDNYKQLSPIVERLIRSMNSGVFDSPDFLIIAEALDGYFKRFVNKKDGKDIRKYEDGIKILLEHFKEVELLQQCNISAEIIAKARHKYSHLIPEDEEGFADVPEGEGLLWLTQKCIVLLTCCILECIGLTMGEINMCCKGSEIQAIVHTIQNNS